MKMFLKFMFGFNLWWLAGYAICGLIFNFDILLFWWRSLIYANVPVILLFGFIFTGIERMVEKSRPMGELFGRLRVNDEGNLYLPEDDKPWAKKRVLELERKIKREKWFHLIPFTLTGLIALVVDMSSILDVNFYAFWIWSLIVGFLVVENLRNYWFKRRIKRMERFN